MTRETIPTDAPTESAGGPANGKARARAPGRAAPGSDRAVVATPRRSPKTQIGSIRPLRRARADSVSREHPVRADSVPGLTAGARPLAIVPRSLDEAMQLARAIVASGLAPRGFDTAEACMVAILHGLEVGLAPLAALQRIAIIEGRPTIWGDGALALVRASGLADLIQEWSEGSGPADWCATCRVKRKGDPHPIERRFSVEDARRADLWGRPGPWHRYPLRMLQMRARAFALRDAFADVLGGLYLREELEGEPHHRPTTGACDPAPAGEGGEAGARTVSVGQSSVARDAATTHPATPEPAIADSGTTKPVAPEPLPHPVTHHRSPRLPLRAHPPSWFGSPAEPDPPSSPTSLPPPDIERIPPPAQPAPSYRRQKRPTRALNRRGTLPRDVAQALRLRREGGWSIPRPRMLAPRSGPIRSRPDSSSGAPADAARLPEARRTARGAALEPAGVLALIDDALSCASDPATLGEIEGELEDRVSALGADDRATAHRIIERHRHRVQALGNPGPDDEPAADRGPGA